LELEAVSMAQELSATEINIELIDPPKVEQGWSDLSRLKSNGSRRASVPADDLPTSNLPRRSYT
jgi:hypothetical protein